MIEIVAIITSTVTTFACLIITCFVNKRTREMEKKNEALHEAIKEQTQRRTKEDMLSLKLINANCALTVGTALAVKRGHANGELDDGLNQVANAQKEYEDFLHLIAMQDINKNVVNR